MKRQLLTYLLIIITVTTYGQSIFSNTALGINLPPIIGKTIDLKIETNPNSHLTTQLAIGYMQDNKLIGTIYKVGDFTKNWNNAGAFVSLGLRYNTRNNFEKSTLFIGTKVIGGYFDQTADSSGGGKIHRTGFFSAIGIESGLTLKIQQRFSIDFGFQYSYPFYKDRQASELFSVLPGIGSIGDLQGILTLKYLLIKTNK